MTIQRRPAVAGTFYTADPHELRHTVEGYLAAAGAGGTPPKALVAPHAGYVYSGPVAARIYARLVPLRDTIRRVVLLGPSHRVPFRGIALSGADEFVTPLGAVPLDGAAMDELADLSWVGVLDEAHAREHSLEVHLPFLQTILESFTLVPLVVGEASAEQVSEVLKRLWGGPETLVVVSSDLSHFHDYATARAMDGETSELIASLGSTHIDGEHACGCRPLNGFILTAREKGLKGEIVDLRNSGDTAGPRDRVVGYGAYGFA